MEKDPDTTIGLRLERLTFEATRGDKIALQVTVSVTVNYVDAKNRERTKSSLFSYEGSPAFSQSWISDEDGFLENNLKDSYRALAENIVVGLSR